MPLRAWQIELMLQSPHISTRIARENTMPDSPCQHARTRLIAKDDDSQYFECLDCGEILEAGELNADWDGNASSGTKADTNGGGSLSDA